MDGSYQDLQIYIADSYKLTIYKIENLIVN